MNRFNLGAAIVAALLASACSGGEGNPLAPSSTSSSTGATNPTTGTTPPVNAPEPTPPGADLNMCTKSNVSVAWDGASRATITNKSTACTAEGVFALFEMPDPLPRFDTQRLYDYKGYRLDPGKSVTLTLNEPSCGEFQGDVLIGVTEAQVRANPASIQPDHPEAMLVAWRTGDTGRSCQPNPTPQCTATMNLAASYNEANAAITVSGGTSPARNGSYRLDWRVNGGGVQNRTMTLGTDEAIPMAQDTRTQNVEMLGTYTDTNGAACTNTATVVIPPKPIPPVNPTCEGTVTDLAISAKHMGQFAVSANLRPTIVGNGLTGSLSADPVESLVPPSNGVEVRLADKQRPAWDKPAASYKYTLTSRLASGEVCGSKSVVLDVPPQDRPQCSLDVSYNGNVTRLLDGGKPYGVEVQASIRVSTFNGKVGIMFKGQAIRIREVELGCNQGETVNLDFRSEDSNYLPSAGDQYHIVSFTGPTDRPDPGSLKFWGTLTVR